MAIKKKLLVTGLVVTVTIISLALFVANKDKTESSADLGSSTNVSTSDVEMPNRIMINDFTFEPGDITIKKGTTITWQNNDSAKHNVDFTSDSMSSADSELLNEGETYSYTFNEVGTFEYICTPHPFMKGTVTVN